MRRTFLAAVFTLVAVGPVVAESVPWHYSTTLTNGLGDLSVDDRTDVFELGGHRYTVHALARESESGAFLDVRVTASPESAPEPGPLALAAAAPGPVGRAPARRRLASALRP